MALILVSVKSTVALQGTLKDYNGWAGVVAGEQLYYG